MYNDTLKCIESLRRQSYENKEILLVLDRNEELYNRYRRSLPPTIKILVNEIPGLSNARNIGVKEASGDVIAFIDDDAYADAHYLSKLMRNYEDNNVIGVGGKILPQEKPKYPEELYWIGGFTYRGYPEKRSAVRNLLGCSMSFKREVFNKAGLFNSSLGRIGQKLVTAEETEFCIRARSAFPDSTIIYDPEAVVYHRVYPRRQTLSYILKRAYYEGKAKADISKMHRQNGNSLSTEGKYLKFLLKKSILERVTNIYLRKNIMSNGKEAMNLILVIAMVFAGYSIGKT
jgi:GT2 family glycosyltransferase